MQDTRASIRQRQHHDERKIATIRGKKSPTKNSKTMNFRIKMCVLLCFFLILRIILIHDTAISVVMTKEEVERFETSSSSPFHNIKIIRDLGVVDEAAAKVNSPSTARNTLPKRVISVFGLESSGTSFVANALAVAVGANDTLKGLIYRSQSNDAIVHHVSEPWGGIGWSIDLAPTIDVIPPIDCIAMIDDQDSQGEGEERKAPSGVPHYCESLSSSNINKTKGNGDEHRHRIRLPFRFFVNITSHTTWYRNQGVDATAVIVIRDYNAHLHGKLSHAPFQDVALDEDGHGKLLITEAMSTLSEERTTTNTSNGRRHHHPELVIVSYESLVFLQETYILRLYRQLGINSRHVPSLHDGNKKYMDRKIDSKEFPGSSLGVAWLMSFPNSGTTFTLDSIRSISNTTTGTNYGQESEFHRERPSTPAIPGSDAPLLKLKYDTDTNMPTSLIVTKTHCDAYCYDCRLRSNNLQFKQGCLSGIKILDSNNGLVQVPVQYKQDIVRTAIHLVRNPLDNIVSRFHLFFNGKKLDRDVQWLQEHPKDKAGFHKWCNGMDDINSMKDFNLPAGVSPNLLKNVPCQAEFFRYIQWHNFAFQTTLDMGIPTMILRYEKYSDDYYGAIDELLGFLKLERVGVGPTFVSKKEYSNYYSPEQKLAIGKMIRELASSTSWEKLGNYFPSLPASVARVGQVGVTNTSSMISLLPGELPSYTGWARPERTHAKDFQITQLSSSVASTRQAWFVEVECSSCPNESRPEFFLRAYGPSIITGAVIENEGNQSFKMSFVFLDPGSYTVEVVLTFSDRPRIEDLPLSHPEPPYEGYALNGFPILINVVESEQSEGLDTVDSRWCDINDIAGADSSVLSRFRWVLSSSSRDGAHHIQTPEGETAISLKGYQRGRNSLGVAMEYRHSGCSLFQPDWLAAGHGSSILSQCFHDTRQTSNPVHVIFIGDSVMRLQRLAFDSFVRGSSLISTSLMPTNGGLVETSDAIIAKLKARLKLRPTERRILIFNEGLHIERLCSWQAPPLSLDTMGGDFSCVDLYEKLLRKLVTFLSNYPAELIAFRTTTAGWHKYGNYGFAWPASEAQYYTRSPNFVAHLNEVVKRVVKETNGRIVLLDGYYISLSRPDHTEVEADNRIGPHMVHPGPEVIRTLSSIWLMLLLRSLCGNSLPGYTVSVSTLSNIMQARSKVVWLMSFPNSGTTFTLASIRGVSNTTTATNYGKESESSISFPSISAIHGFDSPSLHFAKENARRIPEKYIVTKTHCTGYCVECQEATTHPRDFVASCSRGHRIVYSNDRLVRVPIDYGTDIVKKAIHLVRNPLDNIVSRYHKEIKRAVATNNTNWLEMHPRDRTGFHQWCKGIDGIDSSPLPGLGNKAQKLLKDVPCRAEFFKYIQWHNLAMQTTHDMGIPVLMLHYEEYKENYGGVMDKVLSFLALDRVGSGPSFVANKEYASYYSLEQKLAVSKLIYELTSTSSWAILSRYFPSLPVSKHGIGKINEKVSMRYSSYSFVDSLDTTCQDHPHTLRSGHNLPFGSRICSPNGTLQLGFDSKGNISLSRIVFGYTNTLHVLWSVATNCKEGSHLVMQDDGNLVLRGDCETSWTSGTAGNKSAKLVLHDDGLRIYSSGGIVLWKVDADALLFSLRKEKERTLSTLGDVDCRFLAEEARGVEIFGPNLSCISNRASTADDMLRAQQIITKLKEFANVENPCTMSPDWIARRGSFGMWLYPRLKLILFACPKCANTRIRRILNRMSQVVAEEELQDSMATPPKGSWRKNMASHSWQLQTLDPQMMLTALSTVNAMMESTEWTSLGVVRHPYKRFIAGYSELELRWERIMNSSKNDGLRVRETMSALDGTNFWSQPKGSLDRAMYFSIEFVFGKFFRQDGNRHSNCLLSIEEEYHMAPISYFFLKDARQCQYSSQALYKPDTYIDADNLSTLWSGFMEQRDLIRQHNFNASIVTELHEMAQTVVRTHATSQTSQVMLELFRSNDIFRQSVDAYYNGDFVSFGFEKNITVLSSYG